MASQCGRDSNQTVDTVPASVHHHISYQLQARLRNDFSSVQSPLEKFKNATYRDVTILLAEPLIRVTPLDKHIRDVLGLSLLNFQYESEGNPAILTFLHPWPELSEKCPSPPHTEDGIAQDEDAAIMPESLSRKYVNVVLKIWESRCGLDAFRSQKIDQGLMTMLGKIISPCGLTYKPDGLYLRIQDVERSDKRLSCVKVATKKGDILKYLGLEIRGIETFHAVLSRKQVRCDVKDFFGTDFAQEFERLRAQAVFTVDCARLFSRLRKELPRYVKGPELTYAIKGVKRVVGLYRSDYKDVTLDAPGTRKWDYMREAFEQRRYQVFRNEAKKHWIYIGAYQKWLDAKRSAQNYKAYKTRQEARLQERGKAEAGSG
ncbi:hypothetical protein A1O7_06789 [Cladophialophora yegresii CBS 114405]|uniref:Uncharacterized protein n=1 Tax=Cladophialophora yegresii CBS 114405 TaxID=1182544 RepID=W9VTV1_9EURO|nr:uncharacterized protein A1O7_06789 [Cladophialophora yegresii CBS 114405]EXJ56445.1 hypothetical protein A1O7_06789 [Cladophialophora yegresii CBS 114405]